VDPGLGAKHAAQHAMRLGIVPFVREHHPNAPITAKGAMKKGSKTSMSRHTRERHAIPVNRNMVLRAPLGFQGAPRVDSSFQGALFAKRRSP